MGSQAGAAAPPLDETPAGRRLVSLLVALVVTTAVAGNLWPGAVGRHLYEVGLHQSWDVFAPEPAHREVIFEADVTFDDGSATTWRPAHASPLAAYRTHRLELWEDLIVGDGYSHWWERAARWIGRAHEEDGRRPVRVVLRRRWSDLPPPGADPTLRAWHEFDFYALDLR